MESDPFIILLNKAPLFLGFIVRGKPIIFLLEAQQHIKIKIRMWILTFQSSN
jgi:hypothetical protein